MTPTSVFQLGRMRHLDLLALWFQRYPDDSRPDRGSYLLPHASKEWIIAALLGGAR